MLKNFIYIKLIDVGHDCYTVLYMNEYSIDTEVKHGWLKIKKPFAIM